jgi:hypothetical protein
MPAMFIERDRAITEDEWRRAVEAAGARLVPGTLHVELRDDDGQWRHVLDWIGDSAELSMVSYHRPFIAQLHAIAATLGARIIDNDGALYFDSAG